jgi:energy-coupling factor transporter ATP-binding protein EcfA2
MKKLKRMLLVHWHYFIHELIEFDELNFLTGKNSSGKSTIIDAMQLVLLGDTSGTFFNKAASGRGTRTLASYLRGELGDDEESGFRYLRDGRFTSYIALEFYDDLKKNYFTSGCCFDTFGENDSQKLFFRFDGAIPENKFMDMTGEKAVPYSIEALRTYLRQNYQANHGYTTSVNRDFREDLCGKLGGLQPKRFSELLRKAVSFDPKVDIQQFITEFVCGEEQKVDITGMQENIRSYDTLKKEASILKERIELLSKINRLYEEYSKHKENETLYSYLVERSAWEIKKSEIEETKQNAMRLQKQLDAMEVELEKAENEQKQLQTERDSLKLQLDSNENARRLEDLHKQIEEKIRYCENLKDDFGRFSSLLLRATNSWKSCISGINKKIAELDLSVDGPLIDPMLTGRLDDIRVLGEKLKDDTEILYRADTGQTAAVSKEKLFCLSGEADDYRDHCNRIAGRLFDMQGDNAHKQAKLKAEKVLLEKGIYQFPPDAVNLKEAIESRLRTRFGPEAKAMIVAEAAEILNDRWRNVIEGYLNIQKFYIIVEPEHFRIAYQLFDSIKRQKPVYLTGLVDTEKLKDLNPVRDAGSLAEELETMNQAVRLFIDFVLGRIHKCDSVHELRRFKASVTDEGMIYRNFVLRAMDPKQWKNPAIGQGGKRLRLEEVNAELLELSRQSSVYATLIGAFQETERFNRLSETDIEHIIDAINNYQNLPALEETIKRLKADADSIDKSEIETLLERLKGRELDIERIGKEIRGMGDKKATTKERLRVCNEEALPKLEEAALLLMNKLDGEYDNDWIEKTAGPRYDRELSARENAKEIFNAFPREQSRSRNSKEAAWLDIRELRGKYNDAYKMGYDISSAENDNYSQIWHEFSEIKLPEYEAKIEDTRQKAFQQFQEDFLSRLQSNIFNARRQIDELNAAIRSASFGEDTYRFRIIPKPDYKRYYDMIVDEMFLTGGYNLYSEQYNIKYKDEIADLFAIITNEGGAKNVSGYEDYEKRVQVFTDYKTYLDFDLEVIKPGGETERLSKTIGKKSGGETQTPFYIAVLASFVQLYRVGHDKDPNTARLILFDEAFSKMDGERIIQSIELLRRFKFQAVVAAPPDKIPDIATLVDRNLCVLREGRKTCVRPFDPRHLQVENLTDGQ